MSRFQFVRDHRTDYSVKRLCEVLGVNRFSFYKWMRAAERRQQRMLGDAALLVSIRTVFDQVKGCYGAKRIAKALTHHGTVGVVNHKRVARIMKGAGLAGYRRRSRVVTTRSSRKKPVFTDLVQRVFSATRPNALYVGDITYLPLADGTNMYLATVIDCFSRKLAGFAISDHMRTDLVLKALDHARRERGSLSGAVFHSDHGSVYTSGLFTTRCQELGVTQSMGAVGTSADNALAESFNATMKREVLQDRKSFANQKECRREVFSWCVRYNTKRLHSYCGLVSPNAFESQVKQRLLHAK